MDFEDAALKRTISVFKNYEHFWFENIYDKNIIFSEILKKNMGLPEFIRDIDQTMHIWEKKIHCAENYPLQDACKRRNK